MESILFVRQDHMLREARFARAGFWFKGEDLAPAHAKQSGLLLIDTAFGGGV